MRRVRRAGRQFWFQPESTCGLGLFRIAFGLIAFAWAISLFPDLDAFFSTRGIEPESVDASWGVLGHFDSGGALTAVYVALLASALCVLLGYRTRLASVVLFAAIFSFVERAPSVFNSGDGLLRNFSFFLMFAPAGAALSIDRWKTARDGFWEFPARAPWALRLIQVQVSLVYLAAAWSKLYGPAGFGDTAWTNGTALSYVLRLEDLERFGLPAMLAASITLSTVASYLTIAVELMIGVLVWNRAARPMVLALGVGLHLSIDLTLRIGFFSALMLASYITFLSPAAARGAILLLRDRLGRSTSRFPRRACARGAPLARPTSSASAPTRAHPRRPPP